MAKLAAYVRVLNLKLTVDRTKRVSGKKTPEKNPPLGATGRVKVRLGIGLGLESGGTFSGGIFS